MAAVPHRAHPANFPRLGLAKLSGSEPRIRRSCVARDRGRRAPARSGAGLPFCVAAAHGEGSAARRARGDFLAHPLANPEAFGICPWQRELVSGLLGADLIGFQIQAHCDNFLETVDASLESQIEWERFAVKRGGHLTFVKPFPISVDFRESQRSLEPGVSPYVLRSELLGKLGIKANFIGVGVDRVDYTKGLLERLRGVERFLEKWPAYREKFTFIQIGAPSRTEIARYHDFLQ